MTVEEHISLYRYRFGTAQFDESRFELTVGGLAVEIQRKPLEVLAVLLRHANEVVTRDELLETVWEGRPTVEHVVANALAKLRLALGDSNATRIVTQMKVGYRLTGPVERVVVGRHFSSKLDLRVGMAVPRRENFVLQSTVGHTEGSEVWLARHAKTGELRVYKFSPDGEKLAALKREATLSRVLRETLGERQDLVRVIDWNFQEPPFFLECKYAGPNLMTWAETDGNLRSLSEDERLHLFLQIADAVAAAHSVGVLHKDLKPTNILVTVTPGPGGPQLCVSDFGSGRLLERDRLKSLGITQLGLTQTQGVDTDPSSGTPLYLAPELIAGHGPTAQSDVYALGLMLYQLLIGDLRKPMVSGWERDVADEILREDIVKATDGDPGQRLTSAAELAERVRTRETRRAELQRSAELERAARDMRAILERNRVRRPWIIALTATLALGLVITSWLYYRERHTSRLLVESEAQVRRVARRAETVTQFLNENVLSSSDPFLGEAHQKKTIKTALDDAAAGLEGRFAADPETEASIRMALGTVYIRILESEAALVQWQRVVALFTAAGPANDPRLVASRYYLAQALTLASRFDDAKRELTVADDSRMHLPNHSQLELLAHRSWGTFYLNVQQCDRGIPHIEQAVLILRNLPPPDLSSLDLTRILLGQCYTGAGRFKDSERLAHDLIEEVQRRRKPSELTLALARSVYGESLSYQQRYHEAEPALDDAYRVVVEKLGADNFRALSILNARCALFSESDQTAKAVQCLGEAYQQTRQRYGEAHWLTPGVLANLGIEQFISKQYEAALESLSRAHSGLAQTLGADKPLTLFSGYYLARTYLKRGDPERAAALATGLTSQSLAGAEPGAPWEMRLTLLRGLILAGQNHITEASALLSPAAHMSTADDSNDSIIREAQVALNRIGATSVSQTRRTTQ